MKLNAASEMLPLSIRNGEILHPFVPVDQAEGYQTVLKELEDQLTEITGFSATSLQPNSGAQGEYAGLMVIRAYHEAQGEAHRNICLDSFFSSRNQSSFCSNGRDEGCCHQSF